MATLYVIEAGARLEKEYSRLLVTKDDEVLFRVPIQRVSSVVIVGAVGLTTPALHALLAKDIPLFMVSRSGKLLGRLMPGTGYNLPLRQQQYQRNEQAQFGFELAREIVIAKINNQTVLTARLQRRRDEITPDEILRLKKAEQAARQCTDMASLLGIEGSAALAYLDVLQQVINSEWKFTKRSRRPPRDPVNALLSLGYTFLGYAMTTAIETVGLDPYLGYFHAEAYGRPALALDLIEEFRAPVVDSLVLTLVNKRLLQPHDFESDSHEGVRLKLAGMRIFIREFEDRLETEITLPEIGRPLSYRKLFEVQARKIAKLVLGEEAAYTPFLWR